MGPEPPVADNTAVASLTCSPSRPPHPSPPCCSNAPGTLITEERDMSDVLVTSIVSKANVTLVDVTSSRMMGQYGFLAKVRLQGKEWMGWMVFGWG